MSRHIAIFLSVIGICLAPLAALAQGGPGQVQLRLTNAMPQKADLYLSRPATAAPKFISALDAANMVDVPALTGDKWVFAVDRRKFQEYVVGPDAFQHLTLSPAGSQTPAEVGAEYREPVILKPVAAAASASKAMSIAIAPQMLPPAAAANPDGAVWMKTQFVSANNGVPAAQLVFGIPETDATQFVAFCDASGGVPTVTLVADVSQLGHGQPVAVRIDSNNAAQNFRAVVLRSDSGEGMEGFVLDAPPNDPFWTAFGGAGSLAYSAQGIAPRSLPLAGSAGPLGQFLNDCRGFAGMGVAGGSAPGGQRPVVVSGPSSMPANSCQALAGMKSTNGGQMVLVSFVNQTQETRGVDWIDFDGVPQNFGMLEPGQSMEIETWTTHPWMLTDGPGNCIEMATPSVADKVIEITVASPGFGPE